MWRGRMEEFKISAVPPADRPQQAMDKSRHDQAAGAGEMGVRQQDVSRWLLGVRPRKAESITAIARYLEADEDDVMASLPRATRGHRRDELEQRMTTVEREVSRLRADLSR